MHKEKRKGRKNLRGIETFLCLKFGIVGGIDGGAIGDCVFVVLIFIQFMLFYFNSFMFVLFKIDVCLFINHSCLFFLPVDHTSLKRVWLLRISEFPLYFVLLFYIKINFFKK